MNCVTRRGRVAVVLSILMVALAGCDGKGSGNAGEQSAVSADRIAEMNQRLRGVPSLEQVAAEYEALTVRIAAAVKNVVPEFVWEEGQRVGKMACSGELAESEGFVISTTMLVSSVPIPPDKWTPALAVVRTIADEVGLTSLTIRQGQSDSHDVMLNGTDGASLAAKLRLSR